MVWYTEKKGWQETLRTRKPNARSLEVWRHNEGLELRIENLETGTILECTFRLAHLAQLTAAIEAKAWHKRESMIYHLRRKGLRTAPPNAPAITKEEQLKLQAQPYWLVRIAVTAEDNLVNRRPRPYVQHLWPEDSKELRPGWKESCEPERPIGGYFQNIIEDLRTGEIIFSNLSFQHQVEVTSLIARKQFPLRERALQIWKRTRKKYERRNKSNAVAAAAAAS